MWKKIITAVIVIGILGAGYGYYMFNKPVESIEHMEVQETVGANDLLEAFEEDENQANTKYLDKVVEVKGTVALIEKKEKKTAIHLETENPISMIICELEGESTAESVKEGQEVILKGICTGYLMDVIVVRAMIKQ